MTPEGRRAQRVLDWVNEGQHGSRVLDGREIVNQLARRLMDSDPEGQALREVRDIGTVLHRLDPGASLALLSSGGEGIELSRFGSDAAFLSHLHLMRGPHGKFASIGGAGKEEAKQRVPEGLRSRVRNALYGMRHPATEAAPAQLPQRNPSSDQAREIARGIAKRREIAKLEQRTAPRAGAAPPPGVPRQSKTPLDRAIERATARGAVTQSREALIRQAQESGVSPGSHKVTQDSLSSALSDMRSKLDGLNLEGSDARQLADLLRAQAEVNQRLADALHASRKAEQHHALSVTRLQRELRESEVREKALISHEEHRAKAAEKKARQAEEIRSIRDEVRTNNLVATGGVVGALAGIAHFILSLHGEPMPPDALIGVIAPMVDAAVGAAVPALLVAGRARKKLRQARRQGQANLASDPVRDQADNLVKRLFAEALVRHGASELEAASITRQVMAHAA